MSKNIKSFTIDDIRRGEDDNFIHHREYTNQLGKASLSRVYGSTAEFKTRSSEYAKNNTRWVQRVQFEDFTELAKDKDISIDEAVDLVIDEGEVRVSCNCPAFLYWGYAYIDWQLDFEHGKPVTIAPDVRNPNRKGVVCKHLSRVLERFSEHGFNDSLKRLFKTKYGSKYDNENENVESSLYLSNNRFYLPNKFHEYYNIAWEQVGVFVNPTLDEFQEVIESGFFGPSLRGFFVVDSDDVFIWDDGVATHNDMFSKLGFGNENVIRFNIFDMGNNNLRMMADGGSSELELVKDRLGYIFDGQYKIASGVSHG